MKKAFAEVDNQQLSPELESRFAEIKATQAAILARLEKLDPTPPRERREPYAVATFVYSIRDLEASCPLTVIGYLAARIVVAGADGIERSLPLESVRPIEQCPRAQPGPGQGTSDPQLRKELEERQAARIAATTRPFNSPEPIRKQNRYGDGQSW